MPYRRSPIKDPRTVARDIPGISDVIFPQLTPGLVAYLNKGIHSCTKAESVSLEMVDASSLNRAMLFEVAFARGQQIVKGRETDWDACLRIATNRQKRHFDACLPESLDDADMFVAERVGRNLDYILKEIECKYPDVELVHSPFIPGYQWISSSEGDFSIGTVLIEVKCTNKNFGSADYRQILMYWLLSYAASIEHGSDEWSKCVLVNPRLNRLVELSFNEIIGPIAAGRSKVELLQVFSYIVGDYWLKAD